MIEQDKVMEFLMWMNGGFNSLRDHVSTQDPLPKINRVYFLACQVEQKTLAQSFVTNNMDSSAMVVDRHFEKLNYVVSKSTDKPSDNFATG